MKFPEGVRKPRPEDEPRPTWGQQRDELTRMWTEGESVSEIARCLGRSSDSVVRKAGQWGLVRPRNVRER